MTSAVTERERPMNRFWTRIKALFGSYPPEGVVAVNLRTYLAHLHAAALAKALIQAARERDVDDPAHLDSDKLTLVLSPEVALFEGAVVLSVLDGLDHPALRREGFARAMIAYQLQELHGVDEDQANDLALQAIAKYRETLEAEANGKAPPHAANEDDPETIRLAVECGERTGRGLTGKRDLLSARKPDMVPTEADHEEFQRLFLLGFVFDDLESRMEPESYSRAMQD